MTTQGLDDLTEQFEVFRKAYSGTRRGLEVELADFKRKHKNWKEIIPLLLPALERQKAARVILEKRKEFVPAWKNLKTWLHQSCWTLEYPELEEKPRRYYKPPQTIYKDGIPKQAETYVDLGSAVKEAMANLFKVKEQ